MKERKSNFELLRIITMIIIICGHICAQTAVGELKPSDGINYYFMMFVGNGGRLVINCFVMIGAYFLSDTGFKARRVIDLWLEIFFYSVIIEAICYIFKIGDYNITWLVQSFFPIMGRPVWFGAEYICMLLLSPFMNRLLKYMFRVH